MTARLIYMTAANRGEAERIGETLIADRLAACVNILAPMTSMFHWQGAVQRETEVPMIAKTTADLVERLTERVRALHSYDCPCVVAVPIDGGNPAFLDWVAAETAHGGKATV